VFLIKQLLSSQRCFDSAQHDNWDWLLETPTGRFNYLHAVARNSRPNLLQDRGKAEAGAGDFGADLGARIEDRRWRMEDGGSRMEDGGWKMEGGDRR
jgi:hypothetical protein